MANESFVRWQSRTIDAVGYATNLFLTLSIATIGFLYSKISEVAFKFINCYSKFFMLFGFIALIITVILLGFVILNRLNSFRATAQIARKREKVINNGLEDLRKEAKSLDRTTWSLFKISLFTFIVGQLFCGISLYIQIADKF